MATQVFYQILLHDEQKRLLADLNLQMDLPRQAIDRYLDILADHTDESALSNLIIARQHLERYDEALAHLDRFAANTRPADLLMLKAGSVSVIAITAFCSLR